MSQFLKSRGVKREEPCELPPSNIYHDTALYDMTVLDLPRLQKLTMNAQAMERVCVQSKVGLDDTWVGKAFGENWRFVLWMCFFISVHTPCSKAVIWLSFSSSWMFIDHSLSG